MKIKTTLDKYKPKIRGCQPLITQFLPREFKTAR